MARRTTVPSRSLLQTDWFTAATRFASLFIRWSRQSHVTSWLIGDNEVEPWFCNITVIKLSSNQTHNFHTYTFRVHVLTYQTFKPLSFLVNNIKFTFYKVTLNNVTSLTHPQRFQGHPKMSFKSLVAVKAHAVMYNFYCLKHSYSFHRQVWNTKKNNPSIRHQFNKSWHHLNTSINVRWHEKTITKSAVLIWRYRPK